MDDADAAYESLKWAKEMYQKTTVFEINVQKPHALRKKCLKAPRFSKKNVSKPNALRKECLKALRFLKEMSHNPTLCETNV